MLRLEHITKKYIAGNTEVDALKGLDVSFRKTEFVSILGPSGCGKTTLLNIIGGLDKYTDGDLFINGKSTKEFKNRDWDVYRNHRIGFIFQSYNLIPHQTILGNVELALTISGLSKKERVEKAKKALDKVGLANQYKKKPNQLSGGQCQRVAIARALVNEPEILLADEPTGALDTQTSIQIMDLIQEIAKERLVIMVTHNPELAEQYSTRIIRLLDGQIIEDTKPFTREEEIKEVNENKEDTTEKEKAKMSVGAAVKLSSQNLWSKRKRTTMVSFAGSIGIIGVSLVLAISSGIHNYINNMQDDMLSGNPVSIQETSYDMSSLMSGASNREVIEKLELQNGKVNVNSLIDYLMEMNENRQSMMISNDITQDYIDYVLDMPEEYYSAIALYYGIDPTNNIYTSFKLDSNSEEQYRSLSSIVENYRAVLNETSYKDLGQYISMFAESIAQAPGNEDYILTQYDVLDGKVATKANEIMVVVSGDTELTDIVLGELGYYNQEEFLNIAYKAGNDEHYDSSLDKPRFSYEELLGKKFTYYKNDTVYNEPQGFSPAYSYNYQKDDSFDNGTDLEVVGILRPKANISYGCLSSGFYYTSAFTKQFITDGLTSKIASDLKTAEKDSLTSTTYMGVDTGVVYNMIYNFDGEKTKKCYVGQENSFSALMGQMMGQIGGASAGASSSQEARQLSLRMLGAVDVANEISIYPVNFKIKDQVTNYLDQWNKDVTITMSNGKTIESSARSEIKYTDNVGLIISMINSMIDIVSYALIAFTALSLVVSTVMIGIITYVSVVERVKEIGVIRSLGGRKRDVSNLFIAETVIIGLTSGAIGIGITYLISLILNLIMHGLIGFDLAALPFTTALIMIAISVLLTLISGVVPARAAAQKDPVVALRSE